MAGLSSRKILDGEILFFCVLGIHPGFKVGASEFGKGQKKI